MIDGWEVGRFDDQLRDEAVAPDEVVIASCPVCGGIFDHVTGCPEQDKPR